MFLSPGGILRVPPGAGGDVSVSARFPARKLFVGVLMENKAKGKNIIASQLNKRYAILLGITIAFIILYVFTIANFVSLDSITNLIRSSSVMAILACGMTFVILTGGVDLSVGANIAFTGVLAALVINVTGATTLLSALLGALVCIIVATLFGCINGLLMGYLRIPAFIATLATQSLGKGLTMFITGGTRIVVQNKSFNIIGAETFSIGTFNVPYMTFFLVALILLTYVLLNKSTFGRKTYIIGGNATAGKAVGINVSRQIFLVYAYAGLMAGFSTIITIGRSASAQPLAGTDIEFTVITAVVLGGITLSGGAGTLAGSLLGCLLMGVMNMGINMINIPVYFNYIMKGAFILTAVLADQFSNALVTRKAIRENAKKQAPGILPHRPQESVGKIGDFKVFSFRHVNKYFPGVQALDDVSFDVKAGTVHALAGENGAGKSTLMKILSGVYAMDSGEMLVDGKPIRIASPLEAQAKGIVTIYQELTLIPELTVAQNVFLGKEKKTRLPSLLALKAMRARTREIMDHFHMRIDPSCKVNSLTVGKQQMIEIARAFDAQARIVVMDEPTSAISESDKTVLFELIRELKNQGVAILYISHRIQELFDIADEVTILRDGKCIATIPIEELNEDTLIKHMVNREIKNLFMRQRNPIGREVLRVEKLGCGNAFHNVSFSVGEGEVVGMAGLIGAGRTEVARCICGLDRVSSGSIYLNGEKIVPVNTQYAISKGICYVSEDRRREGIIPLMSVRENITAASIGMHSRLGIMDRDKEAETSRQYIDKFGIKTPSDLQLIQNLSGGNQQKCCLARVFACKPKLIIFDEPTRGVDVGAKAEIHKLIESLAKEGIAVILISSELSEVIGASDKIVVMSEGNVTKILDNSTTLVSQEEIMAYATKMQGEKTA